MKNIKSFEEFLTESKLNEYGAKPSADNWLGWFVLNANIRGDMNAWKKGELVKAYTSDDKGYVFVMTGDANYEAYDDWSQSDFDKIAIPLNKDAHKKSYNYVKKLEKTKQLKDWEKID